MKHTLARATMARLLTAALLLSSAAAGAEPTPQDRETARTLLFDGRKKMEEKDYGGAVKSFQAAHAIMGVPTTGIDLARAQEALHLLIEARETALSVTKISVQPGEPTVFGKSRTAAADLAAAIAPRIPSLSITVTGAPASAAPLVSVDGSILPAATLGLPRKLNPGKHSITVHLPGYRDEKRDIELTEGQTRAETIQLVPALEQPKNPAATPAVTSGDKSGSPGLTTLTPPTTTSAAPQPERKNIPVWAWITGAAGIAAGGVAIGFMIDHLDASATMTRDCPGAVCSREKGYTLDSMTALRGRYNRDLGLSIGLGAASLAAVSAGVFGILSAPMTKDTAPRTAWTITPWAAPQGGGLHITGAY